MGLKKKLKKAFKPIVKPLKGVLEAATEGITGKRAQEKLEKQEKAQARALDAATTEREKIEAKRELELRRRKDARFKAMFGRTGGRRSLLSGLETGVGGSVDTLG